MFGRYLAAGVLAASMFLTQPIQAETRSGAQVFDDWDFFIGTMDGVEGQSCIAGTRNVRTEMYLILTPHTGGDDDLIILFRNSQWDIARRPIEIRLNFDNGRYWTLGARGRGDYVISNFGNKENYLDMMEDMASNQTATLKSSDGRTLANFSLKGSRAATIRIEECFEGMSGRILDQTGGGSNPFSSSSDPF